MAITVKPSVFFIGFLALVTLVHATDTEHRRECLDRCQQLTTQRERASCSLYCKSINDERQSETHEEEGEKRERQQPFVFESEHFQTKVETEHGRVKILPNFAETSKLLAGLLNHRLGIVEVHPSAFTVPAYWDAEALIFVAKGNGSITLIQQYKQERFNLKKGDILRIPPGTNVYFVNTGRKEKLRVVKLSQPVSIPGHYETFHAVGGKNPESFLNVFSPELLEFVLNTKKEKFQPVISKQNQGAFLQASEEQIKELSQQESGGRGGRAWPFKGQSIGPFNILEKHPSYSNNYGHLHEFTADENQDLRELNVGVSFTRITPGSMTVPIFNTKAINIAVVIRGEIDLEIARPRQQQGQTGTSYEKLKAQLRKGGGFVVLPGHPFILVNRGSRKDLEVVFFEVNGLGNQKLTLAGPKNVISQLGKAALELSFGEVEKVIREVFENQPDQFFVKGPSQPKERPEEKEEEGFAFSA